MSDHQIFVPYYPCLVPKGGQYMDQKHRKYLHDFQEDMGNIQAVGWNEYKDETFPVLMIKSAAAVSKHLVEWCAGDTSLFTLVWEVKKTREYSMVLVPDLKKLIPPNTKEAIYWAWAFTSVGPSPIDIKQHLTGKGDQKVAFADITTQEIEKLFVFPSRRLSAIPWADPLHGYARHHIFRHV
jgi:hypothetical protein